MMAVEKALVDSEVLSIDELIRKQTTQTVFEVLEKNKGYFEDLFVALMQKYQVPYVQSAAQNEFINRSRSVMLNQFGERGTIDIQLSDWRSFPDWETFEETENIRFDDKLFICEAYGVWTQRGKHRNRSTLYLECLDYFGNKFELCVGGSNWYRYNTDPPYNEPGDILQVVIRKKGIFIVGGNNHRQIWAYANEIKTVYTPQQRLNI